MDAADYSDTIFGRPGRTPGRFGHVAYLPERLPRHLELAPDVVKQLGDTEAALGRLAGAGRLLPNPHLLVRPYLRREALASTRIEGTQASLPDVLMQEARGGRPSEDVEEVLNYIEAMEYGLTILPSLPLSKRMMRQLHEVLLKGVRGRERQPGSFRVTQNWIGDAGASIETARFVPPPADRIDELLDDWELAANEPSSLPTLVLCALLHYQFETIHPFLDGNGRLGRLLIVFHLIAAGRLPSPILYLSPYFEAHRTDYYEQLQGVRERGDFDGFLRFFLRGVERQANDAVDRADRLTDLREGYRSRVAGKQAGLRGRALVDVVLETPVLSSRQVEALLSVTRPTALKALRDLEDLGVLSSTTGPRGQHIWTATEVLEVVSGV